MSEEPRIIDARALRCPLPIIELARAARTAAPGDLLALWWTDPAAEYDVPAWARMRGHQVVSTAPLAAAELDGDTDTDADADAAHVTTVRISPAP